MSQHIAKPCAEDPDDHSDDSNLLERCPVSSASSEAIPGQDDRGDHSQGNTDAVDVEAKWPDVEPVYRR